MKTNQIKKGYAMRSFGGGFVKIVFVFVFLLLVGALFADEPVTTINGIDNINAYINNAEAKDKTKLKKAIAAANKFMKLYLGGDVCSCEPSMEDCKGTIQPLLDYPLFDPKLDKTCGVQGRNLGGIRGRDLKWEPHYILDTDGQIVSIEFDSKNNTALFRYESTLIGLFDINDNILPADSIALWDISVQGQKFKSDVKINLSNYKVIVASTQGDIMPTYYAFPYRISKELPEDMKGNMYDHWGVEYKAKQRELAKKVLKDLNDYKHKKSTNIKQKQEIKNGKQ